MSLDLVARIGGFEQGLDKAARASEKRMKEIKESAQKAGAAIGAALVVGAGTLAAIVNSNLKTIASYQDLADQVGDTASQISSLKPAADLSETAMESVAAASVKLTAGLSKTSEESKGVGKALAAIGIELEAFRNLAPVAQLDAVAKALNNFEDGASKTAVAVTLLGKSGAELIPFLKDLGEQTERNVTLTDEQIAAADEYNKTIQRMKGEVSSVTQQFSARLAPTMELIAKRFGESVKQSGALDSAFRTLEITLKGLISAGAVVGATFNFAQKSLGATAAAAVSAASGDWAEASSILKMAGQDIRADFADTGRFISEMFAGADKALRESAASTETATRATINYSAATEKSTKALKEQKDALREFNRELDRYNDELMKAEEFAQEPARKRQEIRGQFMSPLEQFNKRKAELDDPSLELAKLDPTTYSRAMEAAANDYAASLERMGGSFDKFKTKVGTGWENLVDFGTDAARSLESAFADFLFNPFEQGLKGMLKSFGETMQRIAAQRASEALVNGLINLGMSAFSSFAGPSLPSFGAPIGGPAGSGPSRDSGGRGVPGQAYAIGKGAQPELFIPDTAGTFVPKDMWQGNGMTVVQNFTIQAPTGSVSRSTQQNVAAQAQRGLNMASKRNN